MTPAELERYRLLACTSEQWTSENCAEWIVLNQKYQEHWKANHVKVKDGSFPFEPGITVHIDEVPVWKKRGFYVVKKHGAA